MFVKRITFLYHKYIICIRKIKGEKNVKFWLKAQNYFAKRDLQRLKEDYNNTNEECEGGNEHAEIIAVSGKPQGGQSRNPK